MRSILYHIYEFFFIEIAKKIMNYRYKICFILEICRGNLRNNRIQLIK